ncbi:hypothetical protein D3C77_436700 [compost metagenome]
MRLRPLQGALQVSLDPGAVPCLLLTGKLHRPGVGVRRCAVHVRCAGGFVGFVHVKAVEHARIRQRTRPVGKGIGSAIPAGVDHHRCRRVHFADGRNDLRIQGRQVTGTALLLLIPGAHVCRRRMLGKPAHFLRRRLVDQVIGGDCRMILERRGQIAPERCRLRPPRLVLPQAVVEAVMVVLRPAHAWQGKRRNDYLEASGMGSIESLAQLQQIFGGQLLVAIGIAQEEVATGRLPLVIRQAHPRGAVVLERLEVRLIRRQPIEAVATVTRGIPVLDQVGSLGAAEPTEQGQQPALQ